MAMGKEGLRRLWRRQKGGRGPDGPRPGEDRLGVAFAKGVCKLHVGQGTTGDLK